MKIVKIFLLLNIVVLSLFAQKPVLLENFNLIDGVQNDVLKGQSIIIAGDTIHSVFKSGSPIPFNEIEKIDLSGKFLLPGLYDAHTHVATDPSGGNNLETATLQLESMLKSGIVGIRDMAGDSRLLGFLSRQASLDEISSPDIYYVSLVAGPRFIRDPRAGKSSVGWASGMAPWMQIITEESDLPIVVAKAKGTGAHGIKLYADLSPDLILSITKEAKKQGMAVWGHAALPPVLPSTLVSAGVDGLSHSPMLAMEQVFNLPQSGSRPSIDTVLNENSPKLNSLLKKMVEKNVVFDPTISTYLSMSRPPAGLKQITLQATKTAYRAGVKFVIGTDRMLGNNTALFEEMGALVTHVGMRPIDVIKAATINSAILLGQGNITGSIESGKKANILVVNENPLIDILNLSKTYTVYKNGKRVK